VGRPEFDTGYNCIEKLKQTEVPIGDDAVISLYLGHYGCQLFVTASRSRDEAMIIL
jgi:hypothetical protein